MWTSAGRPKTGTLQQIRLSCKATYKLGIRNAYADFEEKLSDEMCYYFANKNPPEFWKTWQAKFIRNVNKNVNINGYTDNYDIAEEFSKHFEKVYYSSTNDCGTVNNFLRFREELIIVIC